MHLMIFELSRKIQSRLCIKMINTRCEEYEYYIYLNIKTATCDVIRDLPFDELPLRDDDR